MAAATAMHVEDLHLGPHEVMGADYSSFFAPSGSSGVHHPQAMHQQHPHSLAVGGAAGGRESGHARSNTASSFSQFLNSPPASPSASASASASGSASNGQQQQQQQQQQPPSSSQPQQHSKQMMHSTPRNNAMNALIGDDSGLFLNARDHDSGSPGSDSSQHNGGSSGSTHGGSGSGGAHDHMARSLPPSMRKQFGAHVLAAAANGPMGGALPSPHLNGSFSGLSMESKAGADGAHSVESSPPIPGASLPGGAGSSNMPFSSSSPTSAAHAHHDHSPMGGMVASHGGAGTPSSSGGAGPSGSNAFAHYPFLASQSQKQQMFAQQLQMQQHQHHQQQQHHQRKADGAGAGAGPSSSMQPPAAPRVGGSSSGATSSSAASSVQRPTILSVSGAQAAAFAAAAQGKNADGSPSPMRTAAPGSALMHDGGAPNAAGSDAFMSDPAAAAAAAAEAAKDEKRNNKFVYKLYKMVCDDDCQDLISWAPSGTSVIVYNVDEFAAQVLGKHYKHNNFSSFIRQLNMYGFYKVNKTPRGTKNMIESQVWEFSHPQFMRGRTDLLDGIRRRALDTDTPRGDASSKEAQHAALDGSHLSMQRHMDEMVDRLNLAIQQNNALRDFSSQLRDALVQVVDFLRVSNGGQLPFPVHIPWFQTGQAVPSEQQRLQVMQQYVDMHRRRMQQVPSQAMSAHASPMSPFVAQFGGPGPVGPVHSPQPGQQLAAEGPAITVTEAPLHLGAAPGQGPMQRSASFDVPGSFRPPPHLFADAEGQHAAAAAAAAAAAGRVIAARPRRSFDDPRARGGAILCQSPASLGGSPALAGPGPASGMMAAMQMRQHPIGLEIDTALAAQGLRSSLANAAQSLSPNTPAGLFPQGVPGSAATSQAGSPNPGGASPGAHGPGSGPAAGAGAGLGLGLMSPADSATAMMMAAAVSTPLPPSPNPFAQAHAHAQMHAHLQAQAQAQAQQHQGGPQAFFSPADMMLAPEYDDAGSSGSGNSSGNGGWQAQPVQQQNQQNQQQQNQQQHPLVADMLAPAPKSQRTELRRTASGTGIAAAGEEAQMQMQAQDASGTPAGASKRKSPTS